MTETEITTWQEQLRSAREVRHTRMHYAAKRHMIRMQQELTRWQQEIAEIDSAYLKETEGLGSAIDKG